MSTATGLRTTRSSALRAPVLVGLAGAGAFALLHVRDPHTSGSYGFCPFELLTDLPCPGCGGLRSVNDLSRGDVTAAMSSNLMAVVLVAVLVVAWVVWVVRRWRGRDVPMIVLGRRTGVAVIALVLLFWAARLTPWGSWLAP